MQSIFLLRGKTKYTQAIMVHGTSKKARYSWVIPSSPASTAVTSCARVSKENSRSWPHVKVWSGWKGPGHLYMPMHAFLQSADVLTGGGGHCSPVTLERGALQFCLWPTQLPQTIIRAKELIKGDHAGTAHRWGVCMCFIWSCTGVAGIPPPPWLTSFKAYN